MADELKLEVYTFGIRPLHSPKEKASYIPLKEIAPGEDFFDVYLEFIQSLDTMQLYDSYKKALQLQPNSLVQASEKRTISGIFDCGTYGISSDIVNITTNKKQYSKQPDDAEILPFYFLISIPKDRDVGMLVLARSGIFGISTIVHESLFQFLRKKYDTLILDTQPFVSRELIQSFLGEGGVKEIILRKYSLPSDKADKLGLKKYYKSIKSIELHIKAKNTFSGFNKKINNYLKDPNATFFDLPDLRKIGFDENVKYSVKSILDGKVRTLDLTDSMKLRPYYDIDLDVKKDKLGHPIFASIDAIAKELITSFGNEL